MKKWILFEVERLVPKPLDVLRLITKAAWDKRLHLGTLVLCCAGLHAATPPPIPSTPAKEKSHPASVPLWPNGAPGAEARRNEPEKTDWRQEPDIVFPVTFNIHAPSLTPYLPAPGKATGCAVIIAPGGGHMFLTTDREGYDLAEILVQRGIAAFVLKYRLSRDRAGEVGYTIDDAGADALRAVRFIRARAAEWKVKPERVGILGFSAGGEVALLAAARHDAGKPNAADPVERQSSRPDFFAPIYPGGLQRADLAWSKQATPPAFLACTYDDRMPEQLTALFGALRKAGVNAELHIYNSGGHGFGVRERPLAVSGWHARFVEWLGDRGFLK
ncbi:MAG TPA: alpha/beta hydrolase [Opitutaceae bacterium]|nr:alpha/beta hydrolase [Opitutaceae bacterium]